MVCQPLWCAPLLLDASWVSSLFVRVLLNILNVHLHRSERGRMGQQRKLMLTHAPKSEVNSDAWFARMLTGEAVAVSYAKARQEASDEARMRNMCFQQVGNFLFLVLRTC